MQLSVIIPVFNAEPYVKETLDSVFAQQDVELEVIAVDDASTDGSLSILREYAARERRLKVIAQATNRHAGVCRNIGMDASRGTWLHFLDADDRVVSGAYAKFLKVAEAEGLDMIRGNGISADGAYRHRNISPRLFTRMVSLSSGDEELLKVSVVPWLGIVRRQFAVERGFRFSALECANDVSFFMAAIMSARRLRLLDEPLVWHRTGRADSLVSRRPMHYACDFENYALVAAESADAPASLRAQVLSAVLFNICVWLKRYQKCAAERWPQISAYATAFFRDLDLTPWDGKAKTMRWYYEAYRLLGAAALYEQPAFPWRIALDRGRSLANRVLWLCRGVTGLTRRGVSGGYDYGR